MADHADRWDDGRHGPVHRDELLEALFHEALELGESERVDFARRQCAGDPDLAEELAALLSAHGSAPDCLEQEHLIWGADGPGLEDRAGDTIGPYHLIRMLGEGGMGTVFLAQQLRPLARSVALKLIKPGMDTREVVARFQAERQVLAQLNHPHIASVFDAGITPRGRPYFAMEYVPGERITRYCDSLDLPLRDRLRLFRSVCDAVHHAHQKGVIHRDLKPGNILVTEVDGKPVPKIIDFGVAKAINGGGGSGRIGAKRNTLCTRSGQIIGTPAYMSPEQAGAFPAPVDSRTDVYALGVLLNELLTGFLPYDLGSLRGADDQLIRRRLSEVEVVRPALRVAELGLRARRAAARRGSDPRSLSRQLRGDLDWIVLKALDRDPEARYASASELGADIANHLDGEPVTACSPGALYRARKLVAKNRGVVASVAGLIVTGFVALAAFAVSTAGRNDDLLSENVQLITTHDAELQAVQDLQESLLAACDAARDEVGEEASYSTAVIRNLGDTPLLVGEVVELVGVGDANPLGGMVVDVVRATAGSGRPPLGSLDGRWVEQEGHAGHAHHLAEPVPPGGLGVAVTHGLFARVRVDGSCGEILANDALGVSSIPGLACLHSGEGAVVGFALDDWTVSQRGLIRAFITPMPGFVTAQVSPLSAGSTGAAVRLRDDPADPSVGSRSSAREVGPVTAASDGPGGTDSVEAEDAGPPPIQDTASAHQLPVPLSTPSPDAVIVAEQGPAEEMGTESVPLMEDDADEDSNSNQGPPIFTIAAVAGGLVSAENSGGNGVQPEALRADGVGGKAPPAPGGTVGTPPGGSGGPPMHGGGIDLDQGNGEVFGLSVSDEGEDDVSDEGHGNGLSGKPIQLWGDLDADGLLDVLIQVDDQPLVLQHNLGAAGFEDITSWSGLAEHADGLQRAIAWIDVGGDGALDLLMLGDDGHLRLFGGRGDGSFDEVFEAGGLATVDDVREVIVFDVNGDGAPDVRVTTAGRGVLLLSNDGAGRFSALTLRAPEEPGVETSPVTATPEPSRDG